MRVSVYYLYKVRSFTFECFFNLFAGKLSIQEAISLIDKDHLHELKSQCGGLQTLLKNHGHIFEGFCPFTLFYH